MVIMKMKTVSSLILGKYYNNMIFRLSSDINSIKNTVEKTDRMFLLKGSWCRQEPDLKTESRIELFPFEYFVLLFGLFLASGKVTMIIYLFSAVGVAVVLNWIFQSDPRPKFGVYVQKSKWYPLKYALFRVILWHRKRKNEQMKSTSGKDSGYGMRSRNSPEDMDKIQILPEDQPKAVDAVYFNGGNKDGQYIMAATARRQKNIVQTILYLRLPGIGMLEMPSLPDTRLKGSPEGKYAAGGLIIDPVEPMKAWRISYSGKMRNVSSNEEVDVEFTLNWKAFTKYFDFDTELHPAAMADAICREKWSREYFDSLRRAHQTHYEQFGQITGTIKISGMNDVTLDVDGVRDHSYGNIRDWKQLHRYAIQYATLSDRTAICVGLICMPINMSRLLIGYVLHPNGEMDTISWTDFELYNYGEDGNPPDEMSLKFIAGSKEYSMTCKVVESRIFYVGEGRDAKIYERFCTYKVNGVDGWGIRTENKEVDQFIPPVNN